MKLVRSEVMRGIWPSYPKIQPYIRNQPGPFQLSADSRRPSHTPSSSTDSLLPSLLPHSFTASFNFQMECSDGIAGGGMGPLRTAIFHFPEMHLCRHPILVTVRSHASPHRSAHAVTLQRRSDGEMDGRRFLYRACFIKLMPNVVFASAFRWKAGFKHSFDTWKFLLIAGVISTSNTIIHNSLCWWIKCLRKGRRDIFWKKAEKDRGLSTSLLSAARTPADTSAPRSSSRSQQEVGSPHMMLQLLDLSLLNVEGSSSVLLGRCRSLLERRRSGLALLAGWSLFMHARAAVRKTLWMLFSDVKAEHSRYASAPSCLARDEPWWKI